MKCPAWILRTEKVSSSVWYIWADKDELFKAPFHPHFHKHLCLLRSFKECHHQLTHHLAPAAFKSKLKTLDLFCYQNFNNCFVFFPQVCCKCCRNQVTNNLQVFPVSKRNTYGTDIQFWPLCCFYCLLNRVSLIVGWAAQHLVFVQVGWIPSRLHRQMNFWLRERCSSWGLFTSVRWVA